jgi:predicted TIM-barrel fold metal-dependent hydrolase
VVANAQVPNVRAPVEDYLAFARRIGTTRAVVVQPSLYGTRNEHTLNALAAFGGRARAIVVIDESTPTESFRHWTDLGVRGIRFNQVQVGATTMSMLRPLAQRIAEYGWHIQLHMKAAELVQYERDLASLPVDLVLDHAGRVALPDYERDLGWPVLLRLIGKGRTWVKLSGPYHEDRDAGPGYANAVAMGRRLIAAAEDRMLFGSDWPHVTERTPPSPEDVCRYLIACADGDAQLERILVANPRALYGFA